MMSASSTLTHIDPQGNVRMVDVTPKDTTIRTAVATGRVVLGEEAFVRVAENQIGKGNVLSISQTAGIMGAKQTSHLIPLCHPVALSGIDVELKLNEAEWAIDIQAFTKAVGRTGVEMEALTAVSVAALTVYDMCKSVSKGIEITDIRLQAKTGGLSGDYRRSGPQESHL